MKIHLSKPGGEREGPFTVEEINAGLAQHRFRSTDYWAWYDGLESWVPLHEVPGIDETREWITESAEKSKPNLAPADEDTSVIAKTPSPEAKKAAATSPAKSQLHSGM